jgi:hypothetical protein
MSVYIQDNAECEYSDVCIEFKVYVTAAKYDFLAALSVETGACGTSSHTRIQFGISLPEGGRRNLRRNVCNKV